MIPVRKKMHFYADALALAEKYGTDPAHPEIKAEGWDEVRVRGYGKEATRETLRTEIVGVPNLSSLDSYGPAGHDSQKNNKDFKPNLLNAIVVCTWRGRQFKNPKVFATNNQVGRPRQPFNLYDDRSLIENGVFREGKQDWSLERPPQKSEAGVVVHVYLTLVAIVITRCYRSEMETAPGRSGAKELSVTTDDIAGPACVPVHSTSCATALEYGEAPTTPQLKLGMQRYRLELKVASRNKVILFLDDTYGILHVQEMAVLSGVNLRQRSCGIGTREETFRKYGLYAEPTDSRE